MQYRRLKKLPRRVSPDRSDARLHRAGGWERRRRPSRISNRRPAHGPPLAHGGAWCLVRQQQLQPGVNRIGSGNLEACGGADRPAMKRRPRFPEAVLTIRSESVALYVGVIATMPTSVRFQLLCLLFLRTVVGHSTRCGLDTSKLFFLAPVLSLPPFQVIGRADVHLFATIVEYVCLRFALLGHCSIPPF